MCTCGHRPLFHQSTFSSAHECAHHRWCTQGLKISTHPQNYSQAVHVILFTCSLLQSAKPQNRKCVSTDAFFTNWTWYFVQHLSKAVHVVPTVGQKPICNSQNSTTLLPNKTAPAFLFGDSMPCHSKLSLHCLVKAFIINHMSLYLQHVSCFDMLIYVPIVHLYFMSLTFWNWWHPSIHILLPVLELFLLHRNSIFIQWQTYVNDSHISLQYTMEHWGGTWTKRVCIQKNTYLNIILQFLFNPTAYATNMCNLTMSMTLSDHHYMKLHFPHINIYHTYLNAGQL